MEANEEGAGFWVVSSLSFWKLCEDAEFEAIKPVHSESKPLKSAGNLGMNITKRQLSGGCAGHKGRAGIPNCSRGTMQRCVCQVEEVASEWSES